MVAPGGNVRWLRRLSVQHDRQRDSAVLEHAFACSLEAVDVTLQDGAPVLTERKRFGQALPKFFRRPDDEDALATRGTVRLDDQRAATELALAGRCVM